MVPLPPGRFSTMTGWPSALRERIGDHARGDIRRAPGAVGTISVIARVG